MSSTTTRQIAVAAAVLVAGAGGFALARWTAPVAPLPTAEKKILYWYDPMVPGQRFHKPGKSPFMDMQLVPRYAEAGSAGAGAITTAAPGVRIDPAAAQNLGLRLATVRRGPLDTALTVTGTLDFNQRDIAVAQARAAGFVERTYGRAPGDIIAAGAPLADVLVPEWAGAQAEYLAVRRSGDTALAKAAAARLRLLGMTPAAVAALERGGTARPVVTITAPRGGVITQLDVRPGMTLAAGQTLAQIGGLGTVWLNAAVPEGVAATVRTGQRVSATFAGLPEERFGGRVAAVLPATQADSRTLTARIELDNRRGVLRPGMFASIALAGDGRNALLVPSEAVIRTGARVLAMRAEANGRYQPVEIRIGREAGGHTEVLAGLNEGDKVVASGQFLLDSEASLGGIAATPLSGGVAATPLSGGLPEHNR